MFAISTLFCFSRLLSSSEYGLYALVMAVATVISAVFYQWINAAVGRYYPMYIGEVNKVIDVAERGFWASTAVAIVIFLVLLPFSKLFNIEPEILAIIFLLSIFMGRHSLALELANAQGSPLKYGILSWIKGASGLVLGASLISIGVGVHGALVGTLIGLVFGVITFGPKIHIKMTLNRSEIKLTKEMFLFALPLTLNSLSIVIVDLADRIIIATLIGTEKVASYAITYDFVQLTIGSIMSVIFLSNFPMIIKLYEIEGKKSASNQLSDLGSKLITFGFPVVVGFWILSGEIAGVFYGKYYNQEIAKIMPLLAFAIFVGAFKCSFLDVPFQIKHATKYQVYIAVFMATVNIILNLLLIPKFGVIGAAWATLASFVVGALTSWLVGRTLLLLPNMVNVFGRKALASSVMAAILYLLPLTTDYIWLPIKFTFGVFIYGIIIFVLDLKVWYNFNNMIRNKIKSILNS